MPRVSVRNSVVERSSEELVAALAQELRHPKEWGQPLVLEEELSRGLRSVRVIWDRFAPLSEDQRREIILDAFETVEGAEGRTRLSVAVGFTVLEAIDAGLLPYKV